LFARRHGAPPLVKTPGATVDNEHIFIQPDQQDFKLILPPRINDPRSIARSDSHSPTWGMSSLKQPTSRARSPPPSSILRHNAKRERTASLLWRAQNEYRARERIRTINHERRFSQSNFTVEQALLGNGGLRNAIKAASDAGVLKEKTWVGTLGMPTESLEPHMQTRISEKLEHDYESLTVFVSDNDFDGHYSHYSKTILWPVFHYQIPDHPKSKAYEDHSWIHYVNINQAFADRIAKNWKRGDVIWIHDYHLLLLPGMLRKQVPDAQIGFFLHVAFPSSEIFRCLAVRKDLLEGVLGANMIGFQTDEYCHHFLQTCSRILNVEATKDGVYLENRFVNVNTFPLGIDPKQMDERRDAPDVAQWIKIISEKYAGKRIIMARDKLDKVRGVRQKILAYELFLNKYPQYADKIVLIQIATSTTEEAATVSDIVTRVNSAYSTLAHQPLVFLQQDISHSQYLALMTVAECCMITSLREGMNLTSHEFVYCQDGKYSDKKFGPLILSEFTGSASVFENHELTVNPWDYRECADALKTALDMNDQERKTRWHGLYGSVMHHTAMHWYLSYTQHLEQVWKEHSSRETTAVPRLSFADLSEKYQAAERRLFILDYEGTLASWGDPTSIILTTPKRAIDVLNDLIDDLKNTVYVVSARMPEEMERLFRRVPGLGLIAENGCFLMEAGADDWIELTEIDRTDSWKRGVMAILKYYNERIEGSKIEERHCSLIFDYSAAEDPKGAFQQAGECANHINDAPHSLNVHAVPVDRALIVSQADINKSSATALISEKLETLKDKENVPLPDFLFVVGDSREDEYVFNWAHKQKGIRDVVTVTLGARNTEASATLTHGVTGTYELLSTLDLHSEMHHCTFQTRSFLVVMIRLTD
jgi:trehalose 6-phosphate synthase complex regulatory subunit